MSKPNSTWPIWLGLAASLVAIFWFGRNDIRPLLEQFRSRPSAPADTSTPAPARPRYPIELPDPAAQGADLPGTTPLPLLGESDDYFRAILINIFGDGLDEILVSNELIIKFVATADGLSAAKPSRKPWPLKTSLPEFVAIATDDGTAGVLVMSPDNYTRFDYLVSMVTSPAPATLASAYRHLYPLFQAAYVGMGYPNGFFNDRLVDIIDHLLSTPVPAEPIQLLQPRVYYEFADPKLEALSGGQKLLIRMGKDNAAKIRQLLQAFRALIVQPADR